MKMEERAKYWEKQGLRVAERLPLGPSYTGRGALLDDRDFTGEEFEEIKRASDELNLFWGSSHGRAARQLLAATNRRVYVGRASGTAPLYQIGYYLDKDGFHQNLEPADLDHALRIPPAQWPQPHSGGFQVSLTPRELVIAAIKCGASPDGIMANIFCGLDQIAGEIAILLRDSP